MSELSKIIIKERAECKTWTTGGIDYLYQLALEVEALERQLEIYQQESSVAKGIPSEQVHKLPDEVMK